MTGEGGMIRLIVVEDDTDLRETLEECLTLSGFAVDTAGSALAFFQKLATESYDIAIIDVGLPDQSGFDIAELLRKRPEIGIVMMTARGSTEDRIRGFSCGADLYFVKPVDCRELAAAAANLARRLNGGDGESRPDDERGGESWVFDRSGWVLQSGGGAEVALTSAEMRLMAGLLEHPGETVTRHGLMQAVGYADDDYGSRSLEALVRRLRRKIEAATGGGAPIKTVHARGYLFSAAIKVVG